MPKAKVSVTLEVKLLQSAMKLARGRTRSDVVQSALAQWVRLRSREQLDREIEVYYGSLSDAERHEDERWAGLGEETLRRAR